MEKLRHPEDLPKVMSLQLLSEITNNFSEKRKLGSGTYGKVYKGVQNGAEIVVKMLHLTPGSDDFEQFKKEFENLTRLKHQNIVQLLGYCYEVKYEYVDPGDGRRVFAQNIYRALCFEYMHNGSLDGHLSDARHGLDWQARYRIIKGICKGLKYLHEGLENPMYHLDLKPDNILLDKNMVSKLADFGLSKLVRNAKTHATQSSYGTRGYQPPEYIEQNLVSNKFDIFSIGVVMIRLMTGYEGYYKKAEMSSQEFIDLVQKSWRERLQATPGCISLEDECHQVKRCIEIALDCVKADRKQRPEIGTIIRWLSETEHIDEKLGMGSPHKTRPDAVSLIEKASSSDSDLVDEVSSMDIEAAPSQPQQISSVPDLPVETSTEVNEFPVLVRVTAPLQCKESPRAELDLVAVLDVSASMADERMKSMKEAILFLINNLGPDDRLSVVKFNQKPLRLLELSIMSDVNREKARNVVLNMEAWRSGGNMCPAMEMAAEILRERGSDERSNRVGRIIFLSDDKADDSASLYENLSSEFPVETFGLGALHDPNALCYIAERTMGVYSYATDVDKVKDAFAQSLGGLLSVTAMDVQVNLQTLDGVAISSIKSGSYRNSISSDNRSGTIQVPDLYAGEQKNFIVNLTVLEGEQINQFLIVSGSYRNHEISKEATIQLDDSELVVLLKI